MTKKRNLSRRSNRCAAQVEQMLTLVRQAQAKVHPLDRDPTSLVGGEALLAILDELADRDVGLVDYDRLSDQMLAMAEANDVHRDCNNLVAFACGIVWPLMPRHSPRPEDGFMWSGRDKVRRLARTQDDVFFNEIRSLEQQGSLMISFLAWHLREHPRYAALSARLRAFTVELGRMPDYTILE